MGNWTLKMRARTLTIDSVATSGNMIVENDVEVVIGLDQRSCGVITWTCVRIHVNQLSVSFVLEQQSLFIVGHDLYTSMQSMPRVVTCTWNSDVELMKGVCVFQL